MGAGAREGVAAGLGFSLSSGGYGASYSRVGEWMRALGDFYDYKDTDGVGRVYEVCRRLIHPAMRVCREWGLLLLNDKTQVACLPVVHGLALGVDGAHGLSGGGAGVRDAGVRAADDPR